MNVLDLETIDFAKRPVIYVLSDMMGGVTEMVVETTVSQFHSKSIDIRSISFVDDEKTVMEVIDKAKKQKGIIVFTLFVPKMRNFLIQQSIRKNVIAIDIFEPLTRNIQKLFQQTPNVSMPINDEFHKMEAINFSIQHDDGNDPKGILKADIVLIGVSRTSKTPLSQYLAYKRLKVVNVPIMPEVDPPKELFQVSASKCFGLVATPEALNRIRKERLITLGLETEDSYASIKRIKEELVYFKEIINRIGCPLVDVSNRGIEETGDFIFDIYYGEN